MVAQGHAASHSRAGIPKARITGLLSPCSVSFSMSPLLGQRAPENGQRARLGICSPAAVTTLHARNLGKPSLSFPPPHCAHPSTHHSSECQNRDNWTNGAGTTGISKNEVEGSCLVVPQKAKYWTPIRSVQLLSPLFWALMTHLELRSGWTTLILLLNLYFMPNPTNKKWSQELRDRLPKIH